MNQHKKQKQTQKSCVQDWKSSLTWQLSCVVYSWPVESGYVIANSSLHDSVRGQENYPEKKKMPIKLKTLYNIYSYWKCIMLYIILNTEDIKSPVNSSSLISFKSLLDQWSPRAAKTNLWALTFWSAKDTVMSL